MLLSVQAGYDARVPLSNRQDPKQFAQALKRDFKGVALPGSAIWAAICRSNRACSIFARAR
jgi:hypothetical protein